MVSIMARLLASSLRYSMTSSKPISNMMAIKSATARVMAKRRYDRLALYLVLPTQLPRLRVFYIIHVSHAIGHLSYLDRPLQCTPIALHQTDCFSRISFIDRSISELYIGTALRIIVACWELKTTFLPSCARCLV